MRKINRNTFVSTLLLCLLTLILSLNASSQDLSQVEAGYREAIKERSLEKAKAADKLFEALIKKDKSVTTAVLRIVKRTDFLDLPLDGMSPLFCPTLDWIREGVQKVRKDYKDIPIRDEEFFEYLLNVPKTHCLGANRNPVGLYVLNKYYRQVARTTSRYEDISCWLEVHDNGTFNEECGFISDKMLFMKVRGSWKMENGNQLTTKPDYIWKWFAEDRDYFKAKTKNQEEVFTLTDKLIDSSGNRWLPGR